MNSSAIAVLLALTITFISAQGNFYLLNLNKIIYFCSDL